MRKQTLWFTVTAALLLPLLLAGRAPAAQTQTFYVAPTGDDDAPGTQAKPLASLARARDAVRALRRDGKTVGPITVLVRGGTYFLREPLVFSPEDNEADRRARAWPGYHTERHPVDVRH